MYSLLSPYIAIALPFVVKLNWVQEQLPLKNLVIKRKSSICNFVHYVQFVILFLFTVYLGKRIYLPEYKWS